jgi:hypothetical protein
VTRPLDCAALLSVASVLMRRINILAASPAKVARLASVLTAVLLLLGGAYVAGVHQHRDGTASDHCTLCSLAGAQPAPTADSPQPVLPTSERAVAADPSPRLGRIAAARPSTRAPPLA